MIFYTIRKKEIAKIIRVTHTTTEKASISIY